MPSGFTMAGADGKFHPAMAQITGANDITVTSEAVAAPMAVRFGWNDNPLLNLANAAFLPASPFRTDAWPVSTQPK